MPVKRQLKLRLVIRPINLLIYMLWQQQAMFSTITITKILASTQALPKTKASIQTVGVYSTATRWLCRLLAVQLQVCSQHQSGVPKKTLLSAKQPLAKPLNTIGLFHTLAATTQRKISQRLLTSSSAMVSLIRGTQVASHSPSTTKLCPSTSSSLPTILTCASPTKLTAKVLQMPGKPRLNGSLSLSISTKELTSTPKSETRQQIKHLFSDDRYLLGYSPIINLSKRS